MREPAGGTGGGIAKVLARYHDGGGRDETQEEMLSLRRMRVIKKRILRCVLVLV